jgi:hypothetical protein
MSEGGREAVRADNDVRRCGSWNGFWVAKTMEVEILKQALDLARLKQTLRSTSALPDASR